MSLFTVIAATAGLLVFGLLVMWIIDSPLVAWVVARLTDEPRTW